MAKHDHLGTIPDKDAWRDPDEDARTVNSSNPKALTRGLVRKKVHGRTYVEVDL